MSILDKVRPNPPDQGRRILVMLIWYNMWYERQGWMNAGKNQIVVYQLSEVAQLKVCAA